MFKIIRYAVLFSKYVAWEGQVSVEIVEKVTQLCLPDLKYSLAKMFKVISKCLGCEG